jgi:glycosyltransferase involved in cell wall biosynthesis
MPQTNILFVITKLELGGAQKQLLSIIRDLDKNKFTPFLFTARAGMLAAEASAFICNIKRSDYLERPIRPWKDLFSLIEIFRYIKANRISIVHTHSSKAGILGRLAAKFAGVRHIIHTVHGWSFNDCQSYLLRKIFIWLERSMAKFSSRIIVVCRADREKGLKNSIGRAEKYSLIHYGINYEDFSAGNLRARQGLGVGPRAQVITNISCFKPQKAPLDFIKLAASLAKDFPEARFILVGDGQLRPRIEKAVSRMGLEKKVILVGWRRDIAQILAATDIFVLNSLWEGMPVCVLEAMLSSLPVVGTATGGIMEIVRDGKTGFLVSSRDIRQMREKTALLLKDPQLRQEFGRAGRDSLGDEFRTEKMVQRTQALYETLLV